MLASAISEALQRWKDNKPIETITVKPLPDINELNAAVPQSEWEPGLRRQAEAAVGASVNRVPARPGERRVLHLPEQHDGRAHRGTSS